MLDFKTPLGFFVIGGLQVLPMWLYCHYFGVFTDLSIPPFIQYMGIGVLAAGRALCLAVEVIQCAIYLPACRHT